MKHFVAALIGLGFAILQVEEVLAQASYVYKAQNPNKQVSSDPPENWNYIYWGLTSGSMTWWADPRQSNFPTQVRAAVSNWTTQLPQLKWAEQTSEATADVEFRLERSVCGYQVAGCVSVNGAEVNSPSRNANYWQNTTVFIDPDYIRTNTQRVGAIAHEIGHLYGLDERYGTGGACNNSETTIMDGAKSAGDGSLDLCDNLQGPSSLDVSRVTDFWSKGQMVNFTTSANGSIGTVTWQDEAWAETSQSVYWFYWNGTNWINYIAKDYINNIGSHRSIPNTAVRTLSDQVDRTKYSGVPAGQHMMCVAPYFAGWNIQPGAKCAPEITLR
ncbi:MAG: hypothetical protein WBB28_09325 [Crinalium sp.]